MLSEAVLFTSGSFFVSRNTAISVSTLFLTYILLNYTHKKYLGFFAFIFEGGVGWGAKGHTCHRFIHRINADLPLLVRRTGGCWASLALCHPWILPSTALRTLGVVRSQATSGWAFDSARFLITLFCWVWNAMLPYLSLSVKLVEGWRVEGANFLFDSRSLYLSVSLSLYPWKPLMTLHLVRFSALFWGTELEKERSWPMARL